MAIKYCMSCGKKGVVSGGSVCSFCGDTSKKTFASSPERETPTPKILTQKRGRYVEGDEDEGVQYFDIDELGIYELEVDTGDDRRGDESLGSLGNLNPQACDEFDKAAKDFQSKTK